MYIGEQLINPTDDRLKLSSQLGSRGIVIDSRPNREVIDEGGLWDPQKVITQRRRIESYGMSMDCMALDVSSVLLDSLRNRDRAEAIIRRLQQNIRAAGEGGVPMVKYTVAMVGITRTGTVQGRGGMMCSAFKADEYKAENDARFSYWGVVLPEDGAGGAHSPVGAMKTAEAGGQIMASEAGAISEEEGWSAIRYLVENLLPVAEESGVKPAIPTIRPIHPAGSTGFTTSSVRWMGFANLSELPRKPKRTGLISARARLRKCRKIRPAPFFRLSTNSAPTSAYSWCTSATSRAGTWISAKRCRTKDL